MLRFLIYTSKKKLSSKDEEAVGISLRIDKLIEQNESFRDVDFGDSSKKM